MPIQSSYTETPRKAHKEGQMKYSQSHEMKLIPHNAINILDLGGGDHSYLMQGDFPINCSNAISLKVSCVPFRSRISTRVS